MKMVKCEKCYKKPAVAIVEHQLLCRSCYKILKLRDYTKKLYNKKKGLAFNKSNVAE